MTVKEWSMKLNGRQYKQELTPSEREKAKLDRVIIVFGASDDLIEFRGDIYDEAEAYRGNIIQLTNKLTIYDEDDNVESLEFNDAEIEKMRTITAVWCPKGKDGKVWATWCYITDIPHQTFDIFIDSEIYCRGIVFESQQLLLST